MTNLTESMTETILINRYASRKLYNTNTSEYVTLEDIADLIRSGHDVEVRDKKTGEDLTRQVLLQIISERENRGDYILPINLLTDLVRNYNSAPESLIPEFLSRSFDMFKQQQDAFAGHVTQATREAMDPLNMFETAVDVQRQQAELLTSLASSWMSGLGTRPERSSDTPSGSTEPTNPTESDLRDSRTATKSDEVAELKAQIRSLQERLRDIQNGNPV